MYSLLTHQSRKPEIADRVWLGGYELWFMQRDGLAAPDTGSGSADVHAYKVLGLTYHNRSMMTA